MLRETSVEGVTCCAAPCLVLYHAVPKRVAPCVAFSFPVAPCRVHPRHVCGQVLGVFLVVFAPFLPSPDRPFWSCKECKAADSKHNLVVKRVSTGEDAKELFLYVECWSARLGWLDSKDFPEARVDAFGAP